MRAVAGDMWSPAGSDASSADVWLNHPQGKRDCLRDTAGLTSELPVTLSPCTGTPTCTHTSSHATYFHLHELFCFQWELLTFTLYIKMSFFYHKCNNTKDYQYLKNNKKSVTVMWWGLEYKKWGYKWDKRCRCTVLVLCFEYGTQYNSNCVNQTGRTVRFLQNKESDEVMLSTKLNCQWKQRTSCSGLDAGQK